VRAVSGQPAPGGLGFLFAARAERALLVVTGLVYGYGFGMSQQNEFLHGALRRVMTRRWRAGCRKG
jgi:hypothetical protein